MESPLYIAVDLGAGSGRVFLAGVDPGELLLEEILRFRYPPTLEGGHLRWNFRHIIAEIKNGLRMAGSRARELGRPVQSLGVDTWAVDYGLLDADGALIANPICYRDDRTKNAMERVFRLVPRKTIFEKTGIQFQNFNTIYQLASEGGDLKSASRLLLLPDLINYFLTGRAAAEYTNATTTQLMNATSRKWDTDLRAELGFPANIFQQIVEPGTVIGETTREVSAEIGLDNVQVVAPATHDTASAVAAAPIGEDEAYISSGTWSLIGIELKAPIINDEAERLNFTNEGGVYGTIRFLKNVMGLWIFESCRREWINEGIDADYDKLLHGIAELNTFGGLIYPDDPRFLNPPSMIGAIERQLSETGQEYDSDPVKVSKMIFDSLAFRYASVLRTIEFLTGRRLERVQILGGGGKNGYLNQMTADASGLAVSAGLTEATVVGNVIVQAITAGRFTSLSEARRHIADNIEFKEFTPRRSPELTAAVDRYGEIEARFIS